MKVIQVISGNLPIEDTGNRRWGAVELIQSEYQKRLQKLGIDCEIKWLNEVHPNKDTVVHIHVANLCLEARDRGIPYIYSNHDHTSVHYGKGSWLYNQQLEAIKGSVFSITHAESVINFFDETDKLFYLPHGVDTLYYQPNFFPVKEKKLLMVASNGMAGDYGIDRKGFRLGIEAAKILDLPITIVGSEANAEFFKIHSDLLDYPKLTVDSSNPTENTKRAYFQTHSVFLHPSSLEFGSPNLTLLEAWACALPMVAAYDGRRKIDGLVKLDRLDAWEIAEKVVEIYKNYDIIRNTMLSYREFHDWGNTVNMLVKMYRSFIDVQKETTSKSVREQYLNIYQ
jgi:glycosyltransferase involved in cell wall biosynthesis